MLKDARICGDLFGFTPSCARVSPSPLPLPSGSDGSVCVWVKSDSEGEELTAQPYGEDSIEDNQETWTVRTTLRYEGQDVVPTLLRLHRSACVDASITAAVFSLVPLVCVTGMLCLALSQGPSGGYL